MAKLGFKSRSNNQQGGPHNEDEIVFGGDTTNDDSSKMPDEIDMSSGDENVEIDEEGNGGAPPSIEDAGNTIEDNSAGKPDDKLDDSGNGDESSLKEDKETAPAKVGESEVIEYLREHLGGEINSIEDIVKVGAETPESTTDSEDPIIKEIRDWRERTGRPVEDWFKFQKDYSKMSDIEVAREALQLKYPTLSEEKINTLIKKDFLPNEDDLEEESEYKAIELEKFAADARRELEKFKSKFDSPDEGFMPKNVREKLSKLEQFEKTIQERQNEEKAYLNNLNSAAKSLEKVEIELDEGIKIDFSVPESDREKLPQAVTQMPGWTNEDGSVNYQNIISDAAKLMNMDKLLKIAFDQGKSVQEEKVAKEAANITLDKSDGLEDGASKSEFIIEGGESSLGLGRSIGLRRRR